MKKEGNRNGSSGPGSLGRLPTGCSRLPQRVPRAVEAALGKVFPAASECLYSRVNPEKINHLRPHPCLLLMPSVPPGTRGTPNHETGGPYFHSGTSQTPQYFRPCAQELGGRSKGRLGEHPSSAEPYCVQAPHTKAKASECAKEASFLVPACVLRNSRFAGGAPVAEAIRKPGPQIRPSCSLPASLSEGARPQRRTGSQPQLHSSRCLRGLGSGGGAKKDRPGGAPSPAASPAALALRTAPLSPALLQASVRSGAASAALSARFRAVLPGGLSPAHSGPRPARALPTPSPARPPLPGLPRPLAPPRGSPRALSASWAQSC